ncbi:hypothetical protein G9A89_000999 [Geosiphon pyriformis]|nr:hypothetical protein G9A89_000999 [Geosiphon pyriformis]
MDERGYVRLVLERGCQFCDNPRIRKVYWPFQFRSCQACLIQNIRSESTIIEHYGFPKELLECLPYFYRASGFEVEKIYYYKNIRELFSEYESILDTNKPIWIKQKQRDCELFMEDVIAREDAESEELNLKRQEREELIQSRALIIEQNINQMRNEKDHEGVQYQKKYLKECPSYLKARIQPRPFTHRSWKILKGKMKREYTDIVRRYRLQQEWMEAKARGFPRR